MTEPTHLGTDALADVLAGEPRPAHLDTCPACQTALGELAAALGPVATALSALPDPVPPADLERRIARALAEERAATTGTTEGRTPAAAHATGSVRPAGGRPETVPDVLPAAVPLRPRRSRWLPALAGVAAAAALVTGGLVLAGGSGTTNGSTARKESALPTSSTGNDYRRDGKALAAALPALLQGGAAAPGAATALRAPASSPSGAAITAAQGDPLARLRTTAALAACLASLTEPGDTTLPLALDYAAFEGRPALVVVLPTAKPGKVDVYVVGEGCTQADSHLLFFTRLTRP